MIKVCFENVKAKTPLVHNITNYVTVNDVANVLLACGGSPIMADDIDDVEDITGICGGLNINIGTLNKNTIPSMLAAGKKANELGHAVLLDPVGAGASRLRTETAMKLPLRVVVPSFMTCELQRAFMIGLVLYIPFMLIDIVVSSTLMSMGMIMLPPSMISMPFKLLLFVTINGWELLFSSLVQSFH